LIQNDLHKRSLHMSKSCDNFMKIFLFKYGISTIFFEAVVLFVHEIEHNGAYSYSSSVINPPAPEGPNRFVVHQRSFYTCMCNFFLNCIGCTSLIEGENINVYFCPLAEHAPENLSENLS
jgi:hypothetical protein